MSTHTAPDPFQPFTQQTPEPEPAPFDPFKPQTEPPFTLFTSAVNARPHRGSDWTLPDLAAAVRSGQWAQLIGPIRALAQYKNEKDGKRKSSRAAKYSHLKDSTLPYAVVSGTWRLDHRHADGHACKVDPCPGNGMLTASGLRLLDLDDLSPDAQADIKRQLDDGAIPWAAACWKSPGGDGLHVFALLDPAPACQADSHAAFAALLADLAKRLPDAKASSDASAKNLMRPSFISSDPDARHYPDAPPFQWQPPDPFEPAQSATTGTATGPQISLPAETINAALDAMARGRAGEDDSHMLAVLGNMKAMGFTFDVFDQWAADAGCTCERRPRWDSPPAGLQADRPDWAIVNLAAKFYGFIRPSAKRTRATRTAATDDRPAEPVDDSGSNLLPRWVNVGRWVAGKVLFPDYVYEPKSAAWWAWRDECHWEMLLTNSHEVGDILHKHQYALAHQLRLAGADETAALVASRGWPDQVRSTSSPFMAGLREQLTRNLRLPPDHIVAVANGVLNMQDDALHPHDARGPYLITAVANGAYLPEQLDYLRTVIDTRLAPAIPDAERREYLYKCLTLMVGGKAGGNLRGSLLYLLGTSGGGKGNTSRVVADAAGKYSVTGNADALFAKGDINETLARLLELNPRIVMFHESERLPMGKILSMTGRDPIAARGPHKPILERSLSAGVIVTAVTSPQGRMDGGAKRRLASIKFEGKARVSSTTATDATTQEQRDALVTVVLHDAVTMWRTPTRWEPLPDGDGDTWQAVAAADPIEAAIDTLGDEHIGQTLAEILMALQADPDTGDPSVTKLTARAFSARITQREDWKACRHQIDGSNIARLYRPDGCPYHDQTSF